MPSIQKCLQHGVYPSSVAAYCLPHGNVCCCLTEHWRIVCLFRVPWHEQTEDETKEIVDDESSNKATPEVADVTFSNIVHDLAFEASRRRLLRMAIMKMS